MLSGRKLYVLIILAVISVLSLCLFACNKDDRETENSDSQNQSQQEDGKEETILPGSPLPFEIDKTGTINRFYANESNSVNIVIPATYSINENGEIVSGTAYEIKTIGAYSFANNNLIQSVFVPDTVERIEENAFFNCSELSRLNITENITEIGDNAFENCPRLTSIAQTGENGLILSDNKNLKTFSIPSSVTRLEEGAFTNWFGLTKIDIDDGVEYLGDKVFSNCENLEEVNINGKLSYFGEKAFDGCTKLTELRRTEDRYSENGMIIFSVEQPLHKFTVPASIKTIVSNFFENWMLLEELYIPETVTSANSILINSYNLKKLTCGKNNILFLFAKYDNFDTHPESNKLYSVSHVYMQMDYYYIPKSLTEIHLLGEIGEDCLYGMQSVEKVYLPSGIEEFGEGAFEGCTGLKEVYLSANGDWSYSGAGESGVVSRADMNSPAKLAEQLKTHGRCRWTKQ